MAQLNDINFNIGLEISEQTLDRCLQLLGMYFTDHPDKTIKIDRDDRCAWLWVGSEEKE